MAAILKFLYDYLSNFKDFIKSIKLFYILPFDNILFVTDEDVVYGFGSNKNGILGLGHNYEVKEPTIIKLLSRKQICDFRHGCNYCIALSIDGKIYSFGENNFNQLGYTTLSVHNNEPRLIEKLTGEYIVQVSCGEYHNLVLTQNREVYGWGDNKSGQIGIRFIRQTINFPKKINGFNDEKVKSISCGSEHSVALTSNGNVYIWGHTKKENPLERNEFIWFPRKIKLSVNNILVSILKISGGKKRSLLLTTNGDIYTISCNKELVSERRSPLRILFTAIFPFAILLFPSTSYQIITKKIKVNPRIEFLDICCHWSQDFYFALSMNDNVFYISGENCDDVNHSFVKTRYESIVEAFLSLGNLTAAAVNLSETENFLFYKKNFEHKNIISYGGFGIVTKVIDKQDNKMYAIKRISFNNGIERLVLRGTNILKELKSEFVVHVKKVWIENNYLIHENGENYKEMFSKNYFHPVHNPNNNLLLHIQMELCFNTLKEILIQIRNEMSENLYEIKSLLSFYISSELFKEILEAVQFLHSSSPFPIIHRDLKPSNILITYGANSRFVKLGDFGHSKKIESLSQSNTSRVGTHGYMAPEVMRGGNYTTKADVYSLGSFIDQIFNFDINDLRIENVENLELRNKYTILVENQNKMIAYLVKDRIDVNQVLQQQMLWSFNYEKVIKCYKFSIFYNKRVINIEEEFCSYFLKKKLN